MVNQRSRSILPNLCLPAPYAKPLTCYFHRNLLRHGPQRPAPVRVSPRLLMSAIDVTQVRFSEASAAVRCPVSVVSGCWPLALLAGQLSSAAVALFDFRWLAHAANHDLFSPAALFRRRGTSNATLTPMDAAITGLIGSLGGVAVATLTQMLQAYRVRRWQIADRDQASDAKVRDELRAERKALYVRYIEGANKAIKACQWVQLTGRAAHDSQVAEAHVKALEDLEQSVTSLLHITQEVLLVTEDMDVSRAVTAFQIQVSKYDLGEAAKSSARPAEEWEEFQAVLIRNYNRFLSGARGEIGVGPLRLGAPLPDKPVPIPAPAARAD